MTEAWFLSQEEAVYRKPWFDTRAELADIAANDATTQLAALQENGFEDNHLDAALWAFRCAQNHLSVLNHRHTRPD